MVDEKRIRGEEDHVITQAEKDAWQRSSGDALKDKLLQANIQITPERAVALVKLYADSGDLHYVALKLDVTAEQAKRVLQGFNINSIEDARSVVREGVIREFDDATDEEREAKQLADRVEHEEAQVRLAELDESLKPEQKTTEDIDAALAERRDEAQRLNKRDQIRSLISEGIDPRTGESNFRIALSDVSAFKSMIPYGVSQLQRRFGGSQADVVREIKRLAPQFNVDVLRP